MNHQIHFSDISTRRTAYYCINATEAIDPQTAWIDVGRACYWAIGMFAS